MLIVRAPSSAAGKLIRRGIDMHMVILLAWRI